MTTFLLPARENQITTQLDNHFGKSKWYLVVDENGNLLHAVPGDENSHHTRIFKRKEELGFTVTLTPHMGPHAYDVARYFGVDIYMVKPELSILDAIALFKNGGLTPLTSAEDLSCQGCNH